MLAGEGFDPPTSRLVPSCALPLSYPATIVLYNVNYIKD